MKFQIAIYIISLAFASCDRERRDLHTQDPQSTAAPASFVRQSELRPGSPSPGVETKIPYEENAYAMSEGKRLFSWFNCVGCHAQGGGGIGPPLMDAKWIYGSNPENIYATIVEGRPDGMPSFGGKITENEIWQIVAYVRSLSGQESKDASPSRDDHMQAKQPEQAKEKERPRYGSAERKQ